MSFRLLDVMGTGKEGEKLQRCLTTKEHQGFKKTRSARLRVFVEGKEERVFANSLAPSAIAKHPRHSLAPSARAGVHPICSANRAFGAVQVSAASGRVIPVFLRDAVFGANFSLPWLALTVPFDVLPLLMKVE